MMNQLGIDPSMMSQMGGAGGLPGGLDPSQLKGMDMKKLMEIAKKFRYSTTITDADLPSRV